MDEPLSKNQSIIRYENIPAVLTRISISEPIDVNPFKDFNGFFLHQPLETVRLFNGQNNLMTERLFITTGNNNDYFLSEGNALITVSIPWSWLNEILGNFNIDFSFNKTINQIYITQETEFKSKFMELSILYLNRDKVLKLKNEKAIFLNNLKCFSVLFSVLKDILSKELVSNEIVKEEKPKEKDKLQEIYERYICNPLSDIPKIPIISKECGLSVSNFKISFKNRYKCTFVQAHMAVKMNYAKQMLLDGIKVTDVSAKIGYSQPTKFIIAFKKFFHTTPGKVKLKESFTTKGYTVKSRYFSELEEYEQSLHVINNPFIQATSKGMSGNIF